MKVEICGLKRYFGNTKAVDGISFSFESGQIFGFVGPNGSGKTTTMRILATIDEPTGGDAYIDGVSVVQEPEAARRLIGYMPDSLPTYADMTVHEYLDYFARAYGLKEPYRSRMLSDIEGFTRLDGLRERPVAALSKGMKQRVSLARSLIHDPPVIVMDEPAAGLDPRARIELRELLKALALQDKAMLVSSHILSELAEICNGTVIIEQGKLLCAGTLDDIKAMAHPRQLVRMRSIRHPREIYLALQEMPQVENVRYDGGEIVIDVVGGDDTCCNILNSLVTRGYRIVEFRQEQSGLEDIFMSITGGMVQ